MGNFLPKNYQMVPLMQEIFPQSVYKCKEHKFNNNKTYQLVSLTIRSRRSSVKNQLKISKGVLDTSNLTLTPGLPWKLKRLGMLSFRFQANLLVPGTFLFIILAATLESGSSMSCVVVACETESSSSSELDISKHGSKASSKVLGNHSWSRSSSLSSEEKSKKVGTREDCQDLCGGWRRRTLAGGSPEVDGWGSSPSEEEELRLWMLAKGGIVKVSNEWGTSTSIYKGKFLCYELTRNIELTVASKIKATWVTCYIKWPITSLPNILTSIPYVTSFTAMWK